MNKDHYIPLVISVAAIAALALWAPAMWIKGIFIFFVMVSLLCYYLVFPKDTIPDLRLAQGYFVALAIQCLHFIEEYLGEFYVRFPELFELPPIGKDEFVLFNLSAYAVFILGGIALFRNYQSLVVIPIFFVLLGVMANGIIHVLLAVWTAAYFPGLYTGLAYLILGPYLIRMLLVKPRFSAKGL